MYWRDLKRLKKFWSRVLMAAPWECWNWNHRTPGSDARPQIKITRVGKPPVWMQPARFVMHILLDRELTRHEFACHRCDNPWCVNPFHLFLGDKFTNMKDRDSKGRQAKGEQVANSKLSEDDIRIIRGPGKPKDHAKHFNIHVSRVRQIRKGDGWNHIR